MKWFLFLFGFLFFSCNNSQEKEFSELYHEENKSINDLDSIYEPKASKKEFKKPERVEKIITDNVKFDYKLIPVSNRIYNYELKATLYNNNNDTLCFLCMSCFGESDLLEYDKSNFEINNYTICSASNPSVYKIVPFGKHSFKTTLEIKGDKKKIELGFDLFAIKGGYKMEIDNPININWRPQEEKTIIWAKEKRL